MKKKLLVSLATALVLLLGAVALAQALDPDQLPQDWGGLLTLLFGAGAGLTALLPAILIKIRNPQDLLTSKTTWVGVSMILAAFGLYTSGAVPLPGLIGGIYLGLVTIFLRDAVAGISKTATAAAELAEEAATRAAAAARDRDYSRTRDR